MVRLGLIVGTGAADAPGDALTLDTPRGAVEVRYHHDVARNIERFVVSRHARPRRPSHRVNHAANVLALQACRLDAVFALHTVGAIDSTLSPGTLVVPHDLLDLNAPAAHASLFDDEVVHVDFTQPFCPHARAALVAAGARDGGTYAMTRGPRLESAAEIRALAVLGATLVGQTAGPEATLAREAGLHYASLCLVVNAAAGTSPAPLAARDLRSVAASAHDDASAIITKAAALLPHDMTCACAEAATRGRLA